MLVHKDIYPQFIAKVIARTEAIKTGNPLDPSVMMGAQASREQYDKICRYIDIGKEEGAEVLTGGSANDVISGGFYVKPTIFKGDNSMRVFREEIFGPVTCVTTFETDEEALSIANDTIFGLAAGVFTRDAHQV